MRSFQEFSDVFGDDICIRFLRECCLCVDDGAYQAFILENALHRVFGNFRVKLEAQNPGVLGEPVLRDRFRDLRLLNDLCIRFR